MVLTFVTRSGTKMHRGVFMDVMDILVAQNKLRLSLLSRVHYVYLKHALSLLTCQTRYELIFVLSHYTTISGSGKVKQSDMPMQFNSPASNNIFW